MEAIMKLGTSVLVPSVQELAKEKMDAVPSRYIYPHHQDLIISEAAGSLEIPVIDLQSLLSQESGNSELEKLHLACKDWGSSSSSLLEKVKMEIQEIFNLPISEKKKFWQSSEDVEGFGQLFTLSENQKLDWADLFFMVTLPTYMRKPHLFPNLPLPLRNALDVYSLEMKNLAMTIFEHMEKALNIEAMEMRELFEDGIQSMRMNYYPPCPQPDKAIGLTPHSDSVGLTILLQVNEVQGLQIRKDGMWLPVRPLPNAFVLNVGDILEILTNGIYRSIEHRATVNFQKERLSIATFYSLRHDCEVGPLSSLMTEKRPAQFKTIAMKEYVRGLLARELDGKSYLGALRIEHSN